MIIRDTAEIYSLYCRRQVGGCSGVYYGEGTLVKQGQKIAVKIFQES